MKQINNQKELNELVIGDKPVLIDFYADWCGSCRSMMPIVEALAEEHKESFEIVKINIDNNQDIAQQFGVMSIPALFIIKERHVKEHMVGLQTKHQIEEKINLYLEPINPSNIEKENKKEKQNNRMK